MEYVQLSRTPGRAKIIVSRVLGGVFAAAAICLLMLFLRQEHVLYLGPVAVVWVLLLAAVAGVGIYSVFQEKGLYFRCRWPEGTEQ